MKLVGRLAQFAVFSAVFGMATSASAIVISGGPTTSPPGGGSCSVTSGTAPDLTGGVTVTCSGLNVGFYRHLYYGINNAPISATGDSMQSHNPVTGTEIFRYSSNNGSNQLTYSGTTSIFDAQTGVTSSVNERNVIAFQSTSGSLITDGTIVALNNASGDVQYLWQLSASSFTTTVNVLGAFAPTTPTANAAPTVYDPTHTTNGAQEIDHVSLAFYYDTCGNGVREGAEQCDTGANNGSNCCDTDCQFKPSSTVCRSSTGACDPAENCTGASSNCPADAFSASTVVCRSAAGVCDSPETCTGASTLCPADAFLSSTAVCRSAAGACDVAESCTGSSVTCPPDSFVSSTTVCRSAGGVCDQAESCTGTSAACPADAFLSSTTVCRSSAGACDPAESCTGTGAACPADTLAPSTTVCRSTAGVCDVAESCTGTSVACPADAFEPSTTICRSAAGECDVAESCTGTGATCPPDQKQPSGTACTDDGNPCTVDQCDGSSALCPYAAGNAGAVCRSAAGICDVDETCDGTSTACPPDGLHVPGTVCRPAAGNCDVPETCTGAGTACPADSVSGAFVTCRPAAGPCDEPENCTGSSVTCPSDTFKPSTFTCRASAGTCDVAETCTGTGAACPADVVLPSTATCRAATDVCDVAEHCTGSTGICPTDLRAPNGTTCDDGDICTTPDNCQGGVCTGTPSPTACADHYLCYKVQATAFSGSPTVHLVDEFEDVTATSLRARALCTPASKNGSMVNDPTTHLVAYSFKQSIRHSPRQVTTTDQFGTLSLRTTKSDTLLVPTNTASATTPPAPDMNTINVNHYKCYKVKIASGAPKFPKGVQASVEDDFNSPPKLFDVRKPKHVCNPVDKNGEGMKDANLHLVCYQVKGASGQPRHVRRNLFVNNQFGPAATFTIKESELCVPSVQSP